MTDVLGNNVSYGAAGTWRVQCILSDPPATTAAAVTVHVWVQVWFNQSISDSSNTGSYNVGGVTGTFNNYSYQGANTYTIAEFDVAVATAYGAWGTIYCNVTANGMASPSTGPSTLGPGNVNIAPPRVASVPDAPVVGVNTITATSAKVYTVTAGAENGSTTQSVEYAINNLAGARVATSTGQPYSGAVMAGLSPGTSYDAYGRALNGVGYSGWSAPVRFTTPATVPATPAAPTVSAITTTTATGTMVLPANGGAALDQTVFRVYDSGGATVFNYGPALGNTPTTCLLTGLSPGQNYTLGVFAHNSVGYSTESARTPFTTLSSTSGDLNINLNGVWTSADLMMNDTGTWKDVELWMNDNGTWKIVSS